MLSEYKIIIGIKIILRQVKLTIKVSTQDKLFMHTEHRQIIYCCSISECYKLRTWSEILNLLRQCQNEKEVLQPCLYGGMDTARHILDAIRMQVVKC